LSNHPELSTPGVVLSKNPIPKDLNKRKSRLVFLLKAALVLTLLYFLAKKGLLSFGQTRNAFIGNYFWLKAAILIFLANILSIFRWRLLLKAQDIQITVVQAFRLAFLGMFFNLALPGSVSGDFVKAYYAGQGGIQKTRQAFCSILFDRLVGLSALAVLACLSLWSAFQGNLDSVLLNTLRVTFTGAAVLVALAYLYLFTIKASRDPLLVLLSSLQRRFSKTAILTESYLNLRCYHSQRRTVLGAFFLAVIGHILTGWSCFEFAHALKETSPLSVLQVLSIVPAGLLVTAIPLMPGGLGTGHAAFLILFRLIGSERGADVFSLCFLTGVALAIPGALIYLFQEQKRSDFPHLP
jgi:hypothetical protein